MRSLHCLYYELAISFGGLYLTSWKIHVIQTSLFNGELYGPLALLLTFRHLRLIELEYLKTVEGPQI